LYESFTILHGEELIASDRGRNSSIGGALSALGSATCEIIPTWHAQGDAAGSLEHGSFTRMAAEFLDALKPHAGEIDGAYFSMHGSMGTTEEFDPEGFLLQEARKILGESLPIVVSLDLHGVLTARMMQHADAVVSLHTYPHVDFSDTGRRAAELLLRLVNEDVSPVAARVRVPALVRGDELITETGLFGAQMRQAKALEADPSVLSAGFLIGNPFTDVPELCSQAYVYSDGDMETAEVGALDMANAFWPNRARMQAALIGLEDAVSRAAGMEGPIALTDAADATSSGASGNSNALVAEMVRQDYPHTALAPIADPPLAAQAHAVGVGSRFMATIGGTLDPRYAPIATEVEVVSLSDAPFDLEAWVFPQNPGRSAVLRFGRFTMVVTTEPVMHVDRALFFANGIDPRDFHTVVVKSPHCEPRFFDEWVEETINVDAPGATSANLTTLGHTICARPMFPLDEHAGFVPAVERFSRP
jgi:microcystin degradation protein MlrC